MRELINLRDAALALLGGGGAVLNDAPAGPPPADLAGSLRQALAALKAEAISADGARVDYGSLRAGPAYAAYRALVASLRAADLHSLATRAERLAFWINLYNGLVIDAVARLGLSGSVRSAGPGFFRSSAYKVAGLRLSLDDIEHGLLRGNAGHPRLPGPQFAPGDPRLALVVEPPDPRIHFALNCAARSCPPIAAYDAGRIDAQLDLAARGFVGATTSLDPERGLLSLSQLLDWYAADFGGHAGVVRFVADHLPDERRQALLAHPEIDLAFAPYDWSLNS